MNTAEAATIRPATNSTARAGASVPRTGQSTRPRRSPARPAPRAATPRPPRISTWNAVKASTRSRSPRPACSTLIAVARPAAVAAPNSTAPAKAARIDGAWLIAATTPPCAATHHRTTWMSARPAVASSPSPPAAPTPNRATSTPNWNVEAPRTSWTNTTPIENNVPRPRAVTNAAGPTARTIGIRRASTKRPPRPRDRLGGVDEVDPGDEPEGDGKRRCIGDEHGGRGIASPRSTRRGRSTARRSGSCRTTRPASRRWRGAATRAEQDRERRSPAPERRSARRARAGTPRRRSTTGRRRAGWRARWQRGGRPSPASSIDGPIAGRRGRRAGRRSTPATVATRAPLRLPPTTR